AVGQYDGEVLITAAGATGSPVHIAVRLNVINPVTITATPASLSFGYELTTNAPAAQTGALASTPGAVPLSAAGQTDNGGTSWLQVTPTSGTTPANLSISVAPQSLAAGTYTGKIVVTSPASVTPVNINVTLNVTSVPKPVINTVNNAASYSTGAVS